MGNHGGGGGGAAHTCLYREGDARYMAPELLNDDLRHLDRSDIWALGATAYELARKCPLPMKGDSYRKIRENNLALVPSFSEEFCEVVSTMMRSDPEQRPTADQLIHHTFFQEKFKNR